MKRRISDGYRPGSSSLPPRLRPQSAADGGWIAGASTAPEDGRRAAKEGGDGGDAGVPVENEYPSERNGGKEVESDGYGEESDERDDGDDDEDYEVDEPEPELEQDAVAPSAEEDRPILDEGLFEVEAVRKKRVIKGEPQYFIKWRGWPESANTWEPLEHLKLCPEVVDNYEKSLNSGKKTRRRKRKYTHSKKMLQKSYANNSSRYERSSRVQKRAFESGPSYDPSCTSGSKETGGNDNSIDKDNVQMDVTVRLDEAAKVDSSPVNSSSKIDSGSTEANQSERRIGAKRRKSGNVQRFKPDHSSSDPRLARNLALVNGSHSRAQHQTADNVDAYPTIRFDLSRDNATITQIIRPMKFSTAKTNDAEDISVRPDRDDGRQQVSESKLSWIVDRLLREASPVVMCSNCKGPVSIQWCSLYIICLVAVFPIIYQLYLHHMDSKNPEKKKKKPIFW